MLTLAGERADIVSLTTTVGVDERGGFWAAAIASGSALDDKVSWVRRAAGERWRDLELNVIVHHSEVTDDVESAARRAADGVPGDPMRALDSPHVLLGSIDRIVDTLEERRDRFGISYLAVPTGAMDELGPVVARLTGR